ncbi:hypothetical protein M9Y10_042669 [Tritrichomonas musculus]|uniref:Uncharacterized protein n=1 Tax=Tritrichomonas musculus TaxID=1915356 RepID=A0ABR2JXI6_9EUKA
MYNYKFQNQYIFANKTSNISEDDNKSNQEEINEEIGSILNELLLNLTNHNKEAKYYLNKISDIAGKYDICNHPLFISNSIYTMILTLFSPNVPFPIILSASSAISSFSYLFSSDSYIGSPFNIDNLYLILQPETISFIFNCIEEKCSKEISAFTLMLRKYCTVSRKFRDILISEITIESMCEIIKHGIQKNAEIGWVTCLISLLCDICLYPINNSQISSILELFDNFDLFSLTYDVNYIVIHTMRYIIENNDIKPINNINSNQNNNENQGSIHLLMKSKILTLFDPLLNQIKMKQKYNSDLDHQKYFNKIEDDICGVSLSVYFLTDKHVLIIPIKRFIDFLQNPEDSIVYNALTFFSVYAIESKENYDECNKNSFFSYLENCIQFRSAKIRIHAGHFVAEIIFKADDTLLSNLIYQHFFIPSFDLIQFGDTKLSIEMLHVMQLFIQFVMKKSDQNLASILNDVYNHSDIENILDDLLDLEVESDDQAGKDLYNAAYLTHSLFEEFFSTFHFINNENENNENEFHYLSFNENEDFNLFDDENSSSQDKYFMDTKPNKWT